MHASKSSVYDVSTSSLDNDIQINIKWVRVKVFKAILNNISFISWR
jgi:hypothetical protein